MKHRLHTLELALVIASLAVGCGEGIALDPILIKPPNDTIADDGGDPDVDGLDAVLDRRADDARADAIAGDADDVRVPDGPADDVNAGDKMPDGSRDASVEVQDDVPYDASNGSLDVSSDVASDASRDAVSDASRDVASDASRDVASDVPRDISNEGGVDRLVDTSGAVADVKVDVADGGSNVADASHEVQDAAGDGLMDSASHDAFDGCTADCGPADDDYYVDASAPPGGNGSKLNPFKTITAAILAYQAFPGVAKKAHVAAGTYDEALGERFPLFLRGLSLEGAGRDTTLIVGAGTLDHAAEGGIFAGSYLATLVVGDRTLPMHLSGLSVRPSAPVPTPNVYGVFCDRGNATGEVASPGGQTHIDQVQVGPGYDTAMVATASTLPSITGCEMVMTGSIVTGAWFGLIGQGCDANGVQAPVTLDIGGEDPASGNTFSWIQAQEFNAKSLCVWDCVMRTTIQNNAFIDSMLGVETYAGLVPPPYPYAQTHVTAKHNTFERLTVNGWSGIGRGPFLDEFSDNSIIGVSPGPSSPGYGAGTGVSFYLTNAGKVRRNQIIGNDLGLQLLINSPNETGTPADFGTVDDPGGNVFRCNSSAIFPTADFYIDDGNPTWVTTVHAAGNAWDHVPPTMAVDDPAPNGSDISVRDGAGISFDVSNATLSTAVCPDGHVPGQ